MLLLLPAVAVAASQPGPSTFRWSEARELFEATDPRLGHDIGIGTTMGLQGVSGIQIGGRLLGIVNPTLTVSPLLTVDVTVRVNVLPTVWSPQIGAGFVYGYPYDWGEGLGSTPKCGFAHYDVGAEFTPHTAFSLSLGVSIADLNCSTETRLAPVPYLGVAWYYGHKNKRAVAAP